jgi:hypothetical protein
MKKLTACNVRVVAYFLDEKDLCRSTCWIEVSPLLKLEDEVLHWEILKFEADERDLASRKARIVDRLRELAEKLEEGEEEH